MTTTKAAAIAAADQAREAANAAWVKLQTEADTYSPHRYAQEARQTQAAAQHAAAALDAASAAWSLLFSPQADSPHDEQQPRQSIGPGNARLHQLGWIHRPRG